MLEQLGRHGEPGTEVLVEVNVSGEPGKGGVEPEELGEFIDRCPVRGRRADDDAAVHRAIRRPRGRTSPGSRSSRPSTGSTRLSMGTSQDWEVAVDEGATIIRLGTSLYR